MRLMETTLAGRASRIVGTVLLFAAFLVGCTQLGINPGSVSETETALAQPSPTLTNTPTRPPPTPTSSPTPEPTPVPPTPTDTPEPTPTPIELVEYGPGVVEIPILMYHHIDPAAYLSRYNVRPELFESQMALLAEKGYHTVTPSQLALAIREGAMLPKRSVVITFDDGNLSQYEHAFPIMQKYGMIGVAYVVANRIGLEGFLDVGHIQELAEAGWEIGSHGYTHANLTNIPPSQWRDETYYSRKRIKDLTGVKVTTFAYPIGVSTPAIAQAVFKSGYTSAVGIGVVNRHGPGTFYLNRREVEGTFDMRQFETLLRSRR